MQAKGLAWVAIQSIPTRPSNPQGRRRPRDPAHRNAYLLVGLALSAVYLGGLHHGLAGNSIYDLVGLSSAVAIVVGVRVHRARAPLPWYLVAVGQLLFVAGDVVWTVYEVVLREAVPFPSWADALYLAGYPAISAGMLLFAHARSGGRDRVAWIDAAIITTSAAAYAWMFWMEPYASDPSLTMPQRLVSIAYPLGDLLFVAVAARLILLAKSGSRAYFALLASFVLLLVADANYSLQVVFGSYQAGGFSTDGLYLLSYILMGWAGLHPSMTALTVAGSGERRRPTGARLLILTGALVLVPAAGAVEALLGRAPSLTVLVSGSVVLALLVLTRMRGLVRDVEARVDQLEVQEGALRAALIEKEALSEQLRHQALHDSLTGAANRLLLADRIQHALNRQQRTNEPLTVLFLDLDDFKSVNDTFGHSAGDQVLAAAAERLEATVRPGDTVARIGGDEFAVLLEGADESQGDDIARRIVETLALPLRVSETLITIRASIGIAVGAPGGKDADELLRNADVAMYEAKTSGKGRYRRFDARMRDAARERQHVQADLRRALEQGEIVVHYQPIVRVRDHRVVAAEALVRWIHPQRGLVGPGEFLPVAEETGFIYDIDKFVLTEALRQTAVWRQLYEAAARFRVSVNVSPTHLEHTGFTSDVRALLESFRLPGDALALEITETALLRHSANLLEAIEALKSLNVLLALDDFGTGYSSLAHLRRLPVDVLKVDKSFVDDLTVRGRGSALAHVVNLLGEKLALDTVAEGVERRDQLDVLVDFGCDYAQGYLFSRPEPPHLIDDVVRAGVLEPASEAATV